MKNSKDSSSDSMYWQRLPSQSLSFGSSEILTVAECITHATLYQGRSIRTTGQIEHRYCDENAGTVVLELSNLVYKSQRNTTPRVPTQRQLHVGRDSGQKPGFARKRKRPWFGGGTPKLKSNVTVARPRHLKVVADVAMPGLDQFLVGSTIVMVIGTVMQNGSIQARIIKKMNQFDLTMYENSLNARRKMIFQQHLMRTNQLPSEESNQFHQSTPIHGCGPPPYTKFLPA
eukprot:scaffold2816_cov121-Cylindrotheca_fusiformis.AAC.43